MLSVLFTCSVAVFLDVVYTPMLRMSLTCSAA